MHSRLADKTLAAYFWRLQKSNNFMEIFTNVKQDSTMYNIITSLGTLYLWKVEGFVKTVGSVLLVQRRAVFTLKLLHICRLIMIVIP